MKYKFHLLLLLFVLPFLSGCMGGGHYTGTKTPAPRTATSRSYKITNSHMKNKWFHPKQHYEHVEEGYASYYGGRDVFHGRKTSTGEVFDKNKLMAAHRTLPLPSVVRVTNIDRKSKGYGRSIKVRVVDRGPFAHINKRIIDVSEKASKLLGFYRSGTAKVRIETLVDDSIRLAKGKRFRSDNRVRMAKGLRQRARRRVRLARKPKIPSLSLASLSFLTKRTPMPKSSPFAHQSAVRSVSPPQNLVVARQGSPLPHQKPTSIEGLIRSQLSNRGVVNPRKVPVPRKIPGQIKPVRRVASASKAKNSVPRVRKAVAQQTRSTGNFFQTPSQESGIFVQAGTYSHAKNAKALKATLEKAVGSQNVKVAPLKAVDGTLYRVRLGPLNSSEQAEYLLAQLEQQGHDGAHIVYE